MQTHTIAYPNPVPFVDLLSSGTMHAEGLQVTISLQTFAFIGQAFFVLFTPWLFIMQHVTFQF